MILQPFNGCMFFILLLFEELDKCKCTYDCWMPSAKKVKRNKVDLGLHIINVNNFHFTNINSRTTTTNTKMHTSSDAWC